MTRTELTQDITRHIDSLNDEQLAGLHQMVLHLTAEKSVYETAPQHVRDSIDGGLRQAERGEVVSHADVKASTDALLNKHGA